MNHTVTVAAADQDIGADINYGLVSDLDLNLLFFLPGSCLYAWLNVLPSDALQLFSNR